MKIFLDSGAHSIYEQVVKKEGGRDYNYTDSEKFWDYVDRYAEFVKKIEEAVEVYVNVDVIFDADRSWKVQKYLESEHKLNPIPVFHYGEDIKWFKKYMDDYEYFGIGGLGQEISKSSYYRYADELFRYIYDSRTKSLNHMIHGFAMTSPELVLRYPWSTVDSTTWVKFAAYGVIWIPTNRLVSNQVKFRPIPVSTRSKKKTVFGKHFDTLSKSEQNVIRKYLENLGVSIGKSEIKTVKGDEYNLEEDSEMWAGPVYTDGTRDVEVVKELGVSNSWFLRCKVNILSFMLLEKASYEIENYSFTKSLPVLNVNKSLSTFSKNDIQKYSIGTDLYFSTSFSSVHLKPLKSANVDKVLISYYSLDKSKDPVKRFYDFVEELESNES